MILFSTGEKSVHVYDGKLLPSEADTAQRLASGDWIGGVPIKFNNQRRYINPNTIVEAWVKS